MKAKGAVLFKQVGTQANIMSDTSRILLNIACHWNMAIAG
jgi:hypothetical protein